MSKLIQIIFLLLLFYNCDKTIEPKGQMDDNGTNIITIQFFYEEFDGWFKVGRLLNHKYDLQIFKDTNGIVISNKINYYTNTSIETNFDDYFVITNEEDDGLLDVSTDAITYSNTVYYYSNLLYSLLNTFTTYFYSNGVVSSGFLNSNQTIFGVNYRFGTIITFYSNGNVSNGFLNGAQTIQEKDYNNLEKISFDISGNIITN